MSVLSLVGRKAPAAFPSRDYQAGFSETVNRKFSGGWQGLAAGERTGFSGKRCRKTPTPFSFGEKGV